MKIFSYITGTKWAPGNNQLDLRELISFLQVGLLLSDGKLHTQPLAFYVVPLFKD